MSYQFAWWKSEIPSGSEAYAWEIQKHCIRDYKKQQSLLRPFIIIAQLGVLKLTVETQMEPKTVSSKLLNNDERLSLQNSESICIQCVFKKWGRYL